MSAVIGRIGQAVLNGGAEFQFMQAAAQGVWSRSWGYGRSPGAGAGRGEVRSGLTEAGARPRPVVGRPFGPGGHGERRSRGRARAKGHCMRGFEIRVQASARSADKGLAFQFARCKCQ